MSFDDIPGILRDARQWVLRKKNEPKKPCGISNRSGGWQQPDFWISFEEAKAAIESSPGMFSGLGFIIARHPERGDKQLIGVDLDACRDPRNGWVSPWAVEILRKLNSYTELSLSGTGFHVWILGKLPDGMDNSESEGMEPTALPPDVWAFMKALKKSAARCNTIEIYEDGPRHFAMTGSRVAEYSADVEYRPEVLSELLNICRGNAAHSKGTPDAELPEWAVEMAKVAAGKRLPPLNILDVIDTRGWEPCGAQIRGPHPILGSSTGHNLVVNPEAGLWAYMHNGINSGGDAWLWLACECGAVPWEEAGAGKLRDKTIVEKTIAYAVSRQLVNAEDVIREPEIRLLRPDDEPGAIGVAPDGTVQMVILDSKGNREFKWVSDCAIGICTETQEDNRTEFIFMGKGAKDGRKVQFTADAADMAESRKFRSLMINNFGARNRLGKLDFETAQRLSRNTILKERVTIPRWRQNIPLIPGIGLANDVEFRLSQLTPAAVYDGDIDQAKDLFRAMLQLRKYSPLLLATVLGAPVMARWFKSDRFGIALWGKTGSNKTTIAQLFTAIYGIGFLDDRTLLKHGKNGATQVGAMEALLNAGILPRIIDNVKATNSKDAMAYIAIIQAIMEGGEKLRGKKDGGLRATNEYLVTPIVTGEIKVSEASTSARMLNLAWAKSQDTSKLVFIQERAEMLPVIGYYWLRYLAATHHDLRHGFDQARAKLAATYAARGFVNPGRLANIYCLLRGIWTLIEDGPFGDIAREHHDAFVEALNEAIEAQGLEVTAETELARFLSAVRNLRASRPDLFMIGELPSGSDKIIGRENELGLFLFPEETLALLKQMGVFTQVPSENSITKSLKEDGYLREIKDRRRLNTTMINGVKVSGWWLKPGWDDDIPDNQGNEENRNNGSSHKPSGISQGLQDTKSVSVGTYPTNHAISEKDITFREVERNELKDIDVKECVSGIDSIEYSNNTVIDIDFVNPTSNPTPIPSISQEDKPLSVEHAAYKKETTDIDILPELKKKIWDNVGWALRKCPRKDTAKARIGIVLEDITRAGLDARRAEELLRATGWESSEAEASGLKIWWAPEKVLRAYGLA
jgi:hypothetical protein